MTVDTFDHAELEPHQIRIALDVMTGPCIEAIATCVLRAVVNDLHNLGMEITRLEVELRGCHHSW